MAELYNSFVPQTLGEALAHGMSAQQWFALCEGYPEDEDTVRLAMYRHNHARALNRARRAIEAGDLSSAHEYLTFARAARLDIQHLLNESGRDEQ